MSTSGHVQYIRGYHDECVGYHVYIGGCSVHQMDTMMHVGQQFDSFQFLLKTPMYSVLMISSDVLNIPRCTHGIPPHVS